MKIIPVTDPAFAPYGRVVEGYPVAGLLKALEGKTVEEASKVKLDAVTGATYSSKSIIENIHRGLDSLKK